MSTHNEQDHNVRNGIQVLKGILYRHIRKNYPADYQEACKRLEEIEIYYNHLSIQQLEVIKILNKWEGDHAKPNRKQENQG
jgi:hypothetical protein